jgi:hypothetical protein
MTSQLTIFPPLAAPPCSVIFGPPPHTGAQKCCSCGGWIISDVSYWGGTAGPFCPTCWGVPSSYSSPNVVITDGSERSGETFGG